MKNIKKTQQGISLFIIIIFMLLAMLLALWASRSSIFNEMILSNDADYQRAFEAAQTMIQDAELDIRNELSTGKPCTSSASGAVCRKGSNTFKIPHPDSPYPADFPTRLSEPTFCKDGVCLKFKGKQDFWNNTDSNEGVTFSEMQAVGSRYGEYTGAAKGNKSNPILNINDAEKGAWYWIEVLPPTPTAANSLVVTLENKNSYATTKIPKIIYRITAAAIGLKPNTLVVLQQTYTHESFE